MSSAHPLVFATTRTLSPSDPGWPAELAELKRPALRLELAGELPERDRAVAIVGTRFCDPWAADFARALARELSQAGCVIVSGGATGVDTAAHEGALDAGGKTVAVLPSGLRTPYPSTNRGLFLRTVRQGCVLSEISFGEVQGRRSFLERNRLIAALSRVTVVVQAPIRSGSLSTANYARKLQRPLCAVPAAPWDPRGTGCLSLLAEGATICRSAKDVLSLVAPEARTKPLRAPITPRRAKEYQGFDADQRAVFDALADGPMGADDLCERAVPDAARVQRAILMLLLSKVIHEVGGGGYARTDSS